MAEDDILGVDDVEVAREVAPDLVKPLQAQSEATASALRQRQIEEVRSRKSAFTRVMRDGGATLDDIVIVRRVLERFCRKRETTFQVDPRAHAALEGRREVILQIDDYIELSVEDLLNKLA